MTDSNATELLRKLLDERGVKWWETVNHANCTFTWWESPTFGTVHAMDNEDDTGTVFMACLNNCDFAPEQAIAATLRRGECEFVIEDNMNESEGMGDVWFRCTYCGMTYDYYADDWLLKQSYCPHCGAHVTGRR